MSADAHGKPMPGASAHLIASSWTSANTFRRSLVLNLTRIPTGAETFYLHGFRWLAAPANFRDPSGIRGTGPGLADSHWPCVRVRIRAGRIMARPIRFLVRVPTNKHMDFVWLRCGRSDGPGWDQIFGFTALTGEEPRSSLRDGILGDAEESAAKRDQSAGIAGSVVIRLSSQICPRPQILRVSILSFGENLDASVVGEKEIGHPDLRSLRNPHDSDN